MSLRVIIECFNNEYGWRESWFYWIIDMILDFQDIK